MFVHVYICIFMDIYILYKYGHYYSTPLLYSELSTGTELWFEAEVSASLCVVVVVLGGVGGWQRLYLGT